MSRVSLATPRDGERLFGVWEASVRATHDFLTEADVQALIPRVHAILATFMPIHCLRDADGEVVAFMGVDGTEIVMLFVHPDHRGRGAGRTLVEYATAGLGARRVQVNEQNAQAVGFYEHLGFGIVGRSPVDADGRPFPLVHMAVDAVIVPFAACHADRVAAHVLAIQRDEFGIPITLDDQPDLRDVAGTYRRGAGEFWVAEVDGAVVGTIGLLDFGGGQAAVRKMFVARQWRGAAAGIARRLVDVLVRRCRTHGVRDVYLGTTDPMRAAQRFYEKSGFVEMSPDDLPPAFPRMAVDTKFYRRVISAAA
jgi:ribosomal protein S18 acetylase RimI-like enzyme